ncbi:MAG: O-methyltransferase family 3 [Parcubacteria group bacterium GW2011_GWA2_47_12]|nr:MAG: O-methyltransferase family 3 [Parcubacteria group bacterium GW2011_GWA2_47_12]
MWQFLTKYLRVFAGSLFLLTIGVLIGKARGQLAELAEFFGWKNPAKSHPIDFPEITLSVLFPSSLSLTLFDFDGQDGNVSPLELVVLSALVKKHQPRSLFEFGTFDGRTTRNLAENSPEGARVFTLDLPDDALASARMNPKGDIKFAGKVETGYKYKRAPSGAKIVELKGDSAVFDFSPYRQSMDFIFIDGAHTLSYVLCDTENALHILRAGGMIVWHDCRSSCAGVMETLNQLHARVGIGENLRYIRGTSLAVLLPKSFL